MRAALRFTMPLLAFAASAHATVLVDSQGFEAPGFVGGSIEGQQQWVSAGSGASLARVQNGFVLDGAQSLRVDRAAGSDRFWAQPIADPPSGRYISIDWDMRVEPTGATNGAFGPFFGVNAFDDSVGTVGVLAGLGVDATTGEVLYQLGGSGFLEVAGSASLGSWAHYRIELDFGADRYNAFVDGVMVASTGFVDGALGIDRLTDADIAAFAAAGNSASLSQAGTAYFDNFIVRDGLRADYNNDGLVDAADYTAWRDTDGQIGFGLDADGNADGRVDAADYQLWAAAYGQTNGISSASSIPEPSSVVLAALSGALCRPRRRSQAAS